MSRRRHRKQNSILRLSSDTTATLPEYINVGWHRDPYPSEAAHDILSDKPPDYPDSAEEADQDTDSDTNISSPYVPHSSPSQNLPVLSPGRHRRFPSQTYTHRRKKSTASTSSNDPYLDSLLARSVHALEMSNTLLQSSMSTQSSLSAILTSDSPVDSTLETSARGLSSRIHGNEDVHGTWMNNLEEISKGVEGLFSDDQEGSRRINGRPSCLGESSISSSLPTSSPFSQGRRHGRRPSLLDLREASGMPHLHLSLQDRSDLVSPPPRALTQFVASSADTDAITLPSTLGLRASPSLHSLHGSPSLPKLTDRPLEPTTPAYNMLSSFVYRSPSADSSVSTSFTSAIPSLLSSRRNSRNGSTSAECTPNTNHHKSPDCNRIHSDSPTICHSSSSQTPKQIITTLPRSMTPPTEESSSSESGPAKRTIQSLRKILDEQPPPPDPPRLRAPAFLPRTPAPVAEASTSTATASVSRLFTKSKHSSSTRPPSPPPHSAMKQSTPNGNHARTPSSLSLSSSMRSTTSTPSSGRSTPKRISFAKLPESYAESRPEGSLSKFRDRDKKRRGNGEERKGRDEVGESGWWTGWLAGVQGPSALRHDERMEDRLSRSWGGRMAAGFGPTLDEWAI
jgi:hypothetical protein